MKTHLQAELMKNSILNSTKECDNVLECGSGRILFYKDTFAIQECKKCGHRYTLPRDTIKGHIRSNYSTDYFFGGKTGYPNYLLEKELLIRHGIRYAKIINYSMSPGKLLDIGCAAGFHLKGFMEMGWQGMGIEPNDEMVNYGNQELSLNIRNSTLENFESDEKFNLIILIQVIGHIYDIDKSISKLEQLLEDDGLVLVESWDMDSIYARLMGKNWHEYSPPSVIHWFSKKTLINLFLKYGFVPVKAGRPIKKISLKHVLSLLSDKIASKSIHKILKFFEYKLPGKGNMIYPPIDLFWIIFKKNNNGQN